MIKAVQQQVAILRYSYTNLIGPAKGRITKLAVKKQVERLEAAIAWMKAST